MAFGGGCIFKVTGASGDAWFWDGGGPLRHIPSGQGIGSFLQGLGWSLFTISQAALDEMVENFGEGPEFT